MQPVSLASASRSLLYVLSLHCISPNLCRKSLQQFQHFFRSVKNPLVYHLYCSYCFLLVDDRATVVCPNSLCSRDLSRSNSCSFLLKYLLCCRYVICFPKVISMITWVIVLEGSKLIVTVLKTFTMVLNTKKCNLGILDLQHTVSLLWNTDGVPVFKSSKFSIWPLYLIINELHFGKGTKRRNMFFAGLWFGDTKPFMLTFLQPFHSSTTP